MIQQVFFIAVAALFSRSGAVAAPTPKAAAVVDCVKNLQKHLKSDGQGLTLNMNGKFAKPIYGKTRCRGGLEQSKSSFDKGENSFGFIVSANIKSGAALYTHPSYQVPDLRLVPTGDDSHPWGVEHQRDELARFGDIGKASAYLAFMRGETIEPRVFR